MIQFLDAHVTNAESNIDSDGYRCIQSIRVNVNLEKKNLQFNYYSF